MHPVKVYIEPGKEIRRFNITPAAGEQLYDLIRKKIEIATADREVVGLIWKGTLIKNVCWCLDVKFWG